MVQVGPVRVGVDELLMAVPVRVSGFGRKFRVIVRMMPLVVSVCMDVLHRLVNVPVLVLAQE